MNDLIITSWNVRGLNNKIAIKNVRKLLKESKANILFIQETKRGDWSDRGIDELWNFADHGWVVVNSIGAARGLLVSWDKQMFKLLVVESSKRWIWCKGELPSGIIINLINVYGPHDLEEKRQFWRDMRNILSLSEDSPICVMGDINSIRFKEDRENCVYNNRDSTSFNLFMEETGLIELEGLNFSFTWFGHDNKRSRLDRVLVNECWMASQAWKVSAGHRRSSDHLPLILLGDISDWGPMTG